MSHLPPSGTLSRSIHNISQPTDIIILPYLDLLPRYLSVPQFAILKRACNLLRSIGRPDLLVGVAWNVFGTLNSLLANPK